MKDLNLPWTESPFFEEELSSRNLNQQDVEDARFYNENGYLVMEGLFDDNQITAIRNDLEGKLGHHFSREDPRAMNLWQESDAVKELCTNADILTKLQMLYGREAIPFQSLNFKYGSQQNPHSDTIHFNSFPERFMCGVWIALEDMDENNGPLIYYPGSHKLPIYDYQLLSPEIDFSEISRSDQFYRERYEPFIKELMQIHGFKAETLKVKKGDVLIWSSNLIHGGSAIKEAGRTRWSQVNHYYFENCLYYTPQLSNPVTGEWFLRKITDIKTGKQTWGNYNGQIPKRKVARGFRYLLSKYATYNLRDVFFIFTRAYHRFFK